MFKLIYLLIILVVFSTGPVFFAHCQNDTDGFEMGSEIIKNVKDHFEIVKHAGLISKALEVVETNPSSLARAIKSIALGAFEVFSQIYIVHKLDIMGVELQEFGKHLTDLEEGVAKIEKKLDQLSGDVPEIAIKFHFKQNQAKIHDLKLVFDRYVKAQNDHTKDDLVEECQYNNMIKFAGYVQREIQTDTKLALSDLMLSNNDMRKFLTWSKMLGQSLATALLLQSYCLGIQIDNNSTMSMVVAQDKQFFLAIINELEQFIRMGSRQILKKYKITAEQEVSDYAKSHQGENNHDFSKNVYAMLNKKYYWRYWSVISYSGTIVGDEYHQVWVADHVIYWFRKFNRSVYVSSSNDPVINTTKISNDEIVSLDLSYLGERLSSCISEKQDDSKWYYSAKVIYNDLYECILPFNAFAVIIDGNGFTQFGIDRGVVITTINTSVKQWWWFEPMKAKYYVFMQINEIEEGGIDWNKVLNLKGNVEKYY